MATAQNKIAPINIRALEEQRTLIDKTACCCDAVNFGDGTILKLPC